MGGGGALWSAIPERGVLWRFWTQIYQTCVQQTACAPQIVSHILMTIGFKQGNPSELFTGPKFNHDSGLWFFQTHTEMQLNKEGFASNFGGGGLQPSPRCRSSGCRLPSQSPVMHDGRPNFLSCDKWYMLGSYPHRWTEWLTHACENITQFVNDVVFAILVV